MWVTLGSCRVPLQGELQSGPMEGYKCNRGHVGQEMGLRGILPFDQYVPGSGLTPKRQSGVTGSPDGPSLDTMFHD